MAAMPGRVSYRALDRRQARGIGVELGTRRRLGRQRCCWPGRGDASISPIFAALIVSRVQKPVEILIRSCLSTERWWPRHVGRPQSRLKVRCACQRQPNTDPWRLLAFSSPKQQCLAEYVRHYNGRRLHRARDLRGPHSHEGQRTPVSVRARICDKTA